MIPEKVYGGSDSGWPKEPTPAWKSRAVESLLWEIEREVGAGPIYSALENVRSDDIAYYWLRNMVEKSVCGLASDG